MLHVVIVKALLVGGDLLLSSLKARVCLISLCVALRVQTLAQSLEFWIVHWGCHISLLLSK